MPIYEYVCPTCGTFEEMQKFSDPVLTTCPNGHAGVERKISASAFILKGSGWYVTDYARKGDGKTTGKANGRADGKAESPAPADAGSSGGSQPGAEAKPPSESKTTAGGSGA